MGTLGVAAHCGDPVRQCKRMPLIKPVILVPLVPGKAQQPSSRIGCVSERY